MTEAAERPGGRRHRLRISSRRAWVGLLVTATVAVAVAEVAAPAVLGRAVDLALQASGSRAPGDDPPGAATSSTAWIMAGVGLVALRVAAGAVAEMAGGRAWAGATGTLRRDVLRHAVDAGPSLTERHPPGELCSSVVGNAMEAGRAVVACGYLLATAAPAAGSAVALGLLDPWLLLTFAAGLGVAGALLRTFFHASRRVVSRYLQTQAAISSRLVDALAGARTIAAARTVEREAERVLAPLAELREHGRAAWRNLARGGGQGALVGPLVQVGVLVVAGLLVEDGRLTPGQVLAAGWYAGVATGLGDVAAQINQLARARAAQARLTRLLGTPTPRYGSDTRDPGSRAALELRGVTVWARSGGPGPRERLLGGLDLVVPPGLSVALVGPPGSTSALAAVAGRLRDPDDGEVLLGGIALPRLSRPSLRRAVTYAFGRPVLLGDTVAEAIAFGVTTPPPPALRAAARAACADPFVQRLPAGYDTPLAVAPLSGGEVQRLGLARAFAHAGRLVVLDDATSSLDTATELQVTGAITRQLSDRTRLVVAHRASTAARTDLVAWLDGGRLRALAPHAELWPDPDYRAVFDPTAGPAAGRPGGRTGTGAPVAPVGAGAESVSPGGR